MKPADKKLTKGQWKYLLMGLSIYFYLAFSSVYAIGKYLDKSLVFLFLAWIVTTLVIHKDKNAQNSTKDMIVTMLSYIWLIVGQYFIFFKDAPSFYLNNIALVLYVLMLIYHYCRKLNKKK